MSHNVTFALSDDDLAGAPGRFDLVHTYIVLQHIPARRGMRIIERLVEKVAPGGGLSLHVSVDVRHPARRFGATVLHRVPLAYKLSSWAKGRPLSDPAMQMNGYSLQAILVHLAAERMTDVSVRSETHHGVLTFLLTARRPAAVGGVRSRRRRRSPTGPGGRTWPARRGGPGAAVGVQTARRCSSSSGSTSSSSGRRPRRG